ncbi:unnamed protein product [Amoebophrya sp. A120]|nr:unnamed protein product [Amoebophrya sp. A120]|eukprot:GSA120T00016844001.1
MAAPGDFTVTNIKPEHAFGIQYYFDGIIQGDLENAHHDFIYCCGTQLIHYSPGEKKSVFLNRPSSHLQITALAHYKAKNLLAVGEKVFYNGAALAKNYRPNTDSTARGTPALANSLDLGTQITILPASATTEKSKDQARVLTPVNRSSVVQNLKFFSEGTRLLALYLDRTPNPNAKKHQTTFDYVLDLWSLTHERVLQSVEVRNQLLNQIYIMSPAQFLLAGPSYLRIWQMEPMKELDTFFSLKQEKSLKMVNSVHLMMYSEFVSGCANAQPEQQSMVANPVGSNNAPATTATKTVSPEEDFLMIWVFCKDCTWFKFKIKEKTGKTSLMEAGKVIDVTKEEWDNDGGNVEMAAGGVMVGRLPPKPSEIELTYVARWGNANGFLLGGTHGYLGLLKFNKGEKVETLGPFWVNDNYGAEQIKWLSDFKEDVIPKKYRNRPRIHDSQFRIPSVLVLTATSREDPNAGQDTIPLGRVPPPKEDFLRLFEFPIHKREMILGGQLKAASPLFEFHGDSVVSLAAAPKGTKALYSIGSDTSLKSWTYPATTFQTGGSSSSTSKPQIMETGTFSMSQTTQFDYDIPISVAVHPSGFGIAVVFLDRVKYYFTCYDAIHQAWELPLKQPSCCAFSATGDYLAVTTTNFVLLLDLNNASMGCPTILAQYTGHLAVISQILFSVDDRLLMTCGRDGCIYGWEIAGGNRVIEHVSKGSVYVSFCYDGASETVIAVSREGDFRLIKKQTGTVELELKECFFNCLALAPTRHFLAAGTIFGSIRIFDWPLKEVEAEAGGGSSGTGSNYLPVPAGHERFHSIEVLLHTSPVVSLALSQDHLKIFSGDESGSVFCCNLNPKPEVAEKKRRRVVPEEEEDTRSPEQLEEEHWKGLMNTFANCYHRIYSDENRLKIQKMKYFETQRKIQFPSRIAYSSLSEDFVLCSRQFLEDGLSEVQELRERIENVKNDAAYTLAQKEQEVEETVQKLQDDQAAKLQEEADRYEILSMNLAQSQKIHNETTAMKSQEYDTTMRNNEKEHEGRLTKEYEKQNRLVAEIQAMREKNRADILALEESYEAQIDALKKHSEAAMRELRSEYDKVCSMLKTDGLKFEEAMKQQEEEYEAEITEVQDLKRSALQAESERYNGALRDTVSMKNQIGALQTQIRGQQEDLARSSRQQDDLKRKLEEVLDMFRKAQDQLKDREKVIKVKDEALQKLRSNQKHLESFRYVLFHKVQTLEKERDPLEEQVTELKDSVQGMYQEMVQDLRKKQTLETRNAEKHYKIQNLVGEGNVLARNLKATKKDFKNFVSEITDCLDIHAVGDEGQTANKDPTRLISQMKDVVARYEGKVNIYRSNQELAEEEKRTGLPAITDEAMRQRDHLMSKAKAMADSTKFEQSQRKRDTARFTNDNSELILEMNRLRLEKTQAERKITDLEKSLYTLSTENLQLSQMSGPGHSSQNRGSMHSSQQSGSTPYLQRKQKEEGSSQRLSRRKDMNQLPPQVKAPASMSNSQLVQSYEREGFRVERLRDNLPLEGQHETMDSIDEIYTGGPIAPANKFPAALRR